MAFSLTSCIEFSGSPLSYEQCSLETTCGSIIDISAGAVTFDILVPRFDVPFSVAGDSDWFSVTVAPQSPRYSAEPYRVTVTVAPKGTLDSNRYGKITIMYNNEDTFVSVQFIKK